MEIKQILENFGLSKKETQVYITLLALGSVKIQNIAKRISIPRTTIYNTLNYLSNKGFVSFVVKKGVRFYEAADPEKLLDNLKLKQKLLESAMPSLKQMKKYLAQNSSVQMFQGSKGLFTILSDVFKTKQQTYYFGSYSLSLLDNGLPNLLRSFSRLFCSTVVSIPY